MFEPSKTKKTKKQQKHALIFLSIVCCILLSATAGITYMILQSADKELELQVERNLLTQAHTKVAEISTWYGTLTNQAEILSNSDFLRLFTYEATQNFSNYDNMLELSKNANAKKFNPLTQYPMDAYNVPTEDEFNLLLLGGSIPKDNIAAKIELAQQLLILNKNLQNFIERSNFLSASVYNIKHELFATSDKENIQLTEVQKMLMAKALKLNSFVVSNTYHSGNKQLSMDMVQPIFPPAYMSDGGARTIGFLLITLNVGPAINNIIDSKSSKNAIKYWIIQKTDNELVKLSAENVEQPSLSQEWKVLKNNQIPFSTRSLDGDEPNYSLALDVPNLPWLIVVEIPVSTAANTLYSATNLILLIIGIVVIIVLLLITFAWWWLVGQKERKAKSEIVSLYETIEEQKSLLENVNSNLHDGIVMRDISGTILYANEAFAKMMQDSIENIIGSDFRNIFIGKTNMPVNPYITEVLSTGQPRTYTETIDTHAGIQHFQVTYAPYITSENETSGLVGIYSNITGLITTQNSHKLMSLHLITVLKRTIEAFDPYLIGHSTHVGQLATVLAYMCELSEDQVNIIKTAANLSQIGVIQLPYNLRSKTSIFSPEERALMETHIELAKNILHGIEFGLPIQHVIYQMHEKLDGTGYPNKLGGEDICVEARVLSISNTFCAIMRPRAHRVAKGVEQALAILSPANTAYDRNIIKYLHIWLKGHEGKDFVKRLGRN